MVIKKHILALAIIGLSSSIMYAQTESNQTQPVDHNFDLQEAISYAKQNSLLLQNSKLDMTNADETVNQIKSAIYPKVTAGIGYNHYLQVPESWIPNFGGTNPEYIKVAFQTKNWNECQCNGISINI